MRQPFVAQTRTIRRGSRLFACYAITLRSQNIKLTQIRNATLRLDYAGTRFLIDPMLSDKQAFPGFPGTARSALRNPRVALPLSVSELLDVDIVIVTHTHPDHWDEAAQKQMSKQQVIYTQHQRDADLLRSQGFTAVKILDDVNTIIGISVMKTPCQHGSDQAYAIPELAASLGKVCGLIFRHADEKTLYISGDTVWTAAFADTLESQAPDVVVLNIGEATVDGVGSIILKKEDALRTHRIVPNAVIVGSHLEAVNHCLLSRAALRAYAAAQGIEQCVVVPEDGETLQF